MATKKRQKRRVQPYELRKGRGWYQMHRGWQEHPFFGDEPFSKRDAWAWMIEEAIYMDGGSVRNLNGRQVLVMRSQFSHSLRFIAEAWGWDDSKVDRYLKKCQSAGMIKIESKTGQNIITICNYEKYQSEEGFRKRGRKAGSKREAKEDQEDDETKI